MSKRPAPGVVANLLVGTASRALRNRYLMRAPIHLYRAGLGFLLGSRILMLEHTGRKTGARRYVVLEVIGRPAADSYIVVSGFGTRSQWFRNLQAEPKARIWSGWRRGDAVTARVLDPDEASAALADYAAEHPRAWATMKPAIEDTLGHPIDSGTELPMVKLHGEAAT